MNSFPEDTGIIDVISAYIGIDSFVSCTSGESTGLSRNSMSSCSTLGFYRVAIHEVLGHMKTIHVLLVR